MLLRIDDIVSGLSQKGGPGAGAGTGTGVAPSQDDEEDPEAERSAGLYDDLFAEVKRAGEMAQKVS